MVSVGLENRCDTGPNEVHVHRQGGGRSIGGQFFLRVNDGGEIPAQPPVCHGSQSREVSGFFEHLEIFVWKLIAFVKTGGSTADALEDFIGQHRVDLILVSDRKSTRLNSVTWPSRMPSSA